MCFLPSLVFHYISNKYLAFGANGVHNLPHSLPLPVFQEWISEIHHKLPGLAFLSSCHSWSTLHASQHFIIKVIRLLPSCLTKSISCFVLYCDFKEFFHLIIFHFCLPSFSSSQYNICCEGLFLVFTTSYWYCILKNISHATLLITLQPLESF